jgi:hypothetical protein
MESKKVDLQKFKRECSLSELQGEQRGEMNKEELVVVIKFQLYRKRKVLGALDN